MPNDPRTIAFDPRAPQDERTDALAQLQKAHMPTAREVAGNQDRIRAFMALATEHLAETDELLKAQGKIITLPGVYERDRGRDDRGPQSVMLDDLQVQVTNSYYERPSSLSFDALREMVRQTPVLEAVIATRIRQVSRFTQISEDGGPGFEIRHKEKQHKLTPDEQVATKLLASFMENSGWETKARKRKRMKRANLTAFCAMAVRDTLTMDAMPIETEWKRNKNLGFDGFYNVDGATIRLCTEEGYEGDDEIFALQLVQGRVTTAYSYDTLIYEVRNPRADVRLGGYGVGETEMLIRVVTGFLNAMTYNIKGFDENSIPKGLLQLVGDYGQEDLIAFRRQWNMMVSGVNNTWKLPILVNKDPQGKATYERLGNDFDEMHFAKFMSFLVSMICAVYSIGPDEINFESFASDKSGLSGSDTAEKLASSKDKGLRPLMSFLETTFSDFLVAEFDDRFVFRWVGMDDEDPKEAWDKDKMCLSVDELRAQRGYEGWKEVNKGNCPDFGTAPLNPSLVGPWAQAAMPAPQQPGQEFGGEQPQQGQDFGGEGGEQPDYGQSDDQGNQGGGGAGGGAQAGDDQGADQPTEAQPVDDDGAMGKALTTLIWSVMD